MKVNRIILSSKVGHFLDDKDGKEAYSVGAQCHPLVESVLVQTVSRLFEDALISASVDKVVNLNVDPRPQKINLMPTDLVVRFVFPLRPTGTKAGWNSAEIVTNVKEIGPECSEQIGRWGTTTSNVFDNCVAKSINLSEPYLQIRPFYLDGPGALIFAERLENLAYRLATVLSRSLRPHSGLYRVVSEAPQGRRE